MDIGSLNKRVEVWGMESIENELFEIEHKPTKIKTIWGQIVPQTGSIGSRAGTEFAEVTHKIIVRYASGKDITTSHILKYKGHRYEVMYPLNAYEADITIEIFVKEVLE